MLLMSDFKVDCDGKCIHIYIYMQNIPYIDPMAGIHGLLTDLIIQ